MRKMTTLEFISESFVRIIFIVLALFLLVGCQSNKIRQQDFNDETRVYSFSFIY